MDREKIIKVFPVFIILLALLVRGIYFSQVRSQEWITTPILDAKIYNDWAKDIYSGDWMSKEKGVFFMNPGYPYFLAIIYRIFGLNLNTPLVIQFILGALGCFFIYLIGERIFNPLCGIIASLIAAFYGIAIFYEGLFLSAVLINFINLLLILLILIAWEKKKNIWWFLSGVILGISTLFRPNILLFIPFVLIWVLIMNKKSFTSSWRASLIFLLGIFLIIFPVTMRNWIIGKKLVLTTSSFGMNFYIGNNQDAAGTLITDESSELLRTKETSNTYFLRALSFIKENPVKWIKLIVKKFVIFFSGYEVQSNYNYNFLRNFSSLLSKIPLFSFGIICPLGIMGMALARLNKKALLLFFYTLAYLLTGFIFFVLSEYRFPVAPVFMIFTAYLIVNLMKEKKLGNASLLVLCSGGLFLGLNRKIHNPHLEISHRNLGMVYRESGRFNKAIFHLNEAAKINPDYQSARLDLGVIYKKEGKYQTAIREFEKVIEINPLNAKAYYNLGNSYRETGQFNKAIACFKKTIEIDQAYPEAHNNLGVIYAENGEYEKAISQYQKTLAIDPDSIQARKNLRIALLKKENIVK